MKVLVIGAGVIGCIYAVRMNKANIDVTLLVHEKHYEDLKQKGVIIRNPLTEEVTTAHLPLTLELGASDFYDLVIVTVRLNQLESILLMLKQNTTSFLIMFMMNNPGSDQLTNELAHKQIILGFPGAGGTYRNGQIEYVLIKQQATTIGDADGITTNPTREIKTLLERAGFKVIISSNMQAWLKTHAVFVACMAAAIIKENGDSVQLGKKRPAVRIMVRSIREGFKACRNLGMTIAPANLKTIFLAMPEWFAVFYWQRAMQGKVGTLAMAPHVRAAKDEMQVLAKKVLDMVHTSGVPTPALDNLLNGFLSLKSQQQ